MVSDHTCAVAVENGRLEILTTDPGYTMFVRCHICDRVLFPRFLSHSPFSVTKLIVFDGRPISPEYAKDIDPPWRDRCLTCRPMKMLWEQESLLSDGYSRYQLEKDMQVHFEQAHRVYLRPWLRALHGGEPDPVPF